MDFYPGFRDGSVNDPKVEIAGNRNTVFVSLRLIQSRLKKYELFSVFVLCSEVVARPISIRDVRVASGTKGMSRHVFRLLRRDVRLTASFSCDRSVTSASDVLNPVFHPRNIFLAD
jgi:hypothetical protein